MRLLLCFMLSLSLSLACDQPYEEVYGYKIGCPRDFTNDNEIRAFDSKVARYKLKDEYIQKGLSPASISVYVMDGNIESMTFSRSYGDYQKMRNDLESILSDVKDTWGEYEKEGSRRISYTVRDPKSEILDNVAVIDVCYHNGYGLIHVRFFSKKIQSHFDLMHDIRQKEAKEGWTILKRHY